MLFFQELICGVVDFINNEGLSTFESQRSEEKHPQKIETSKIAHRGFLGRFPAPG